ncbi:Cytochrome P450 83B1 [Glycine max]|nr:Cytochrome P450 83B1 [Glycine max]
MTSLYPPINDKIYNYAFHNVVTTFSMYHSPCAFLNLQEPTPSSSYDNSKKYGPIFSLQLGLRPAIVVSSPKLAKEVLKKHDLEFSGRPKLLGQQKLSYNGSGIAFSSYNEYWIEIRKICVVHIFSSKRVSSFSSIREFEVKQMIKKISGHAFFGIAFGRRYEDEGSDKSRFHVLLNELQAMMSTFFVSDYIPFMG